jgi:hypothetical protein
MDRLPQGAALAAALFTAVALIACGGGGGSSTTVTPAAAPPAVQTIDGVTTPSSVSVVTAKNAE